MLLRPRPRRASGQSATHLLVLIAVLASTVAVVIPVVSEDAGRAAARLWCNVPFVDVDSRVCSEPEDRADVNDGGLPSRNDLTQHASSFPLGGLDRPLHYSDKPTSRGKLAQLARGLIPAEHEDVSLVRPGVLEPHLAATESFAPDDEHVRLAQAAPALEFAPAPETAPSGGNPGSGSGSGNGSGQGPIQFRDPARGTNDNNRPPPQWRQWVQTAISWASWLFRWGSAPTAGYTLDSWARGEYADVVKEPPLLLDVPLDKDNHFSVEMYLGALRFSSTVDGVEHDERLLLLPNQNSDFVARHRAGGPVVAIKRIHDDPKDNYWEFDLDELSPEIARRFTEQYPTPQDFAEDPGLVWDPENHPDPQDQWIGGLVYFTVGGVRYVFDTQTGEFRPIAFVGSSNTHPNATRMAGPGGHSTGNGTGDNGRSDEDEDETEFDPESLRGVLSAAAFKAFERLNKRPGRAVLASEEHARQIKDALDQLDQGVYVEPLPELGRGVLYEGEALELNGVRFLPGRRGATLVSSPGADGERLIREVPPAQAGPIRELFAHPGQPARVTTSTRRQAAAQGAMRSALEDAGLAEGLSAGPEPGTLVLNEVDGTPMRELLTAEQLQTFDELHASAGRPQPAPHDHVRAIQQALIQRESHKPADQRMGVRPLPNGQAVLYVGEPLELNGVTFVRGPDWGTLISAPGADDNRVVREVVPAVAGPIGELFAHPGQPARVSTSNVPNTINNARRRIRLPLEEVGLAENLSAGPEAATLVLSEVEGTPMRELLTAEQLQTFDALHRSTGRPQPDPHGHAQAIQQALSQRESHRPADHRMAVEPLPNRQAVLYVGEPLELNGVTFVRGPEGGTLISAPDADGNRIVREVPPAEAGPIGELFAHPGQPARVTTSSSPSRQRGAQRDIRLALEEVGLAENLSAGSETATLVLNEVEGTRIRELLTPEQLQTFDALHQSTGRPQPDPHGHAQAIQQALSQREADRPADQRVTVRPLPNRQAVLHVGEPLELDGVTFVRGPEGGTLISAPDADGNQVVREVLPSESGPIEKLFARRGGPVSVTTPSGSRESALDTRRRIRAALEAVGLAQNLLSGPDTTLFLPDDEMAGSLRSLVENDGQAQDIPGSHAEQLKARFESQPTSWQIEILDNGLTVLFETHLAAGDVELFASPNAATLQGPGGTHALDTPSNASAARVLVSRLGQSVSPSEYAGRSTQAKYQAQLAKRTRTALDGALAAIDSHLELFLAGDALTLSDRSLTIWSSLSPSDYVRLLELQEAEGVPTTIPTDSAERISRALSEHGGAYGGVAVLSDGSSVFYRYRYEIGEGVTVFIGADGGVLEGEATVATSSIHASKYKSLFDSGAATAKTPPLQDAGGRIIGKPPFVRPEALNAELDEAGSRLEVQSARGELVLEFPDDANWLRVDGLSLSVANGYANFRGMDLPLEGDEIALLDSIVRSGGDGLDAEGIDHSLIQSINTHFRERGLGSPVHRRLPPTGERYEWRRQVQWAEPGGSRPVNVSAVHQRTRLADGRRVDETLRGGRVQERIVHGNADTPTTEYRHVRNRDAVTVVTKVTDHPTHLTVETEYVWRGETWPIDPRHELVASNPALRDVDLVDRPAQQARARERRHEYLQSFSEPEREAAAAQIRTIGQEEIAPSGEVFGYETTAKHREIVRELLGAGKNWAPLDSLNIRGSDIRRTLSQVPGLIHEVRIGGVRYWGLSEMHELPEDTASP